MIFDPTSAILQNVTQTIIAGLPGNGCLALWNGQGELDQA